MSEFLGRVPRAIWFLAIAGALLLGAGALVAACIEGLGECFNSATVENSTFGYDSASAVLDSQHPVFEQRITIHINTAALPSTGLRDETIEVDPGPDQAPTRTPVASAPASVPAPVVATAGIPQVTLIRDDANTVVTGMLPADGFGPSHTGALAFATLDCPVGNSCVRVFRIRVAAPDLEPGQSLAVSWSVDVRLRYTGLKHNCGTPDGASVTIGADDPVAIGPTAAAFAPPIPEHDPAGAILARHITIVSDEPAPVASSIRLSIKQPTRAPTDTPWRPWVRVLPDGSDTALASAVVGSDPYGPGPDGGTLDVPVLGDCPPAGPCTRGYWIIFQSYAVAPGYASVGPASPPPNLGQLTWSVDATATYANSASSTPHLSLTFDNVAADLPVAILEQAAEPVDLSASPEPSSLEATFSLPDRPASKGGLDPLAASIVIVHVDAENVAFGVHLEGDGAGTLIAGWDGGGTANLIAHPFDACPPSGACTVHVRLVGPFAYDPQFIGREGISWGVTVLGAPQGLTVSFAPRFDPPPWTGPSIEQVVALAWVIVLAVLAILIWRRRRAARTTG